MSTDSGGYGLKYVDEEFWKEAFLAAVVAGSDRPVATADYAVKMLREYRQREAEGETAPSAQEGGA